MLRTAIVRALVVGVGGSLLGLCVLPFTSAVFLPPVVFVLTLIELRAATQTTGARIRWALVLWAVACVGIVAAYFQGVYLEAVVKHGSIDAGLDEVRRRVLLILDAIPAAPFGRDFTERDRVEWHVLWVPAWLAPGYAASFVSRAAARATKQPTRASVLVLVLLAAVHASAIVAVTTPASEDVPSMVARGGWIALIGIMFGGFASWIVGELIRYSETSGSSPVRVNPSRDDT